MIKIGWKTLVVAMALVVATKMLPVSALAIWPQRVEIIEGRVAVQRFFMSDVFGMRRPRISYVETVRGLTHGNNGGRTCHDAGGPFRYVAADEIGSWDISEWAAPCLSDPFGYTWESCWTWHVGNYEFGAICASRTNFTQGLTP